MLSDGMPPPARTTSRERGAGVDLPQGCTAHVHGHIADGAELPPAILAGVHGLLRSLVQDVALGAALVAAAHQEVTRVAECHSAADTVTGHRYTSFYILFLIGDIYTYV